MRHLIAAVLALALVIAACDAADDPVTDDDGEEAAEAADEDEPAGEPEPEPEPEPESAPEPAPADEEAEEDEAGPDDVRGSSRDDSIPVGETADITGWEIRVVETIPDGTDAVLDENQFNDPPEEGRQFFLARVEATFTGEGVDDDSGQFWIDVITNVVDDNNVTYSALDDYCGVVPDALEDTSEVFEGGSVEGNLCWPVDSEAVDSLVMFAEATFSLDDTRTWFALE